MKQINKGIEKEDINAIYLYGDLIGLPEDPRNWEMPAPDVEKAMRYKEDAEWWFGDG